MSEHNVDKNSQLFVGLVASLSSQAWMQMGKIKNPMSDKIERDLDAASMSIDMITMMKAKTEGNLSDEEKNFVEQTLRDLQMNFVAEKAKPEQEEKSEEEESSKKETVEKDS
ncbi:MAG: DUF1844 domain-containing protein [Candidatus Marinimicrobia bacterium]|nr:DUF1844 domain-containing protein [Candidatus Neomarinimicrobiota bacterium]MBL7022603.1 DUF1844 domain-containing protein [Candidatus Neomarinimicrobiota bacterium]MBL7109862.1 DUF1844 domain-containing protein [Candidatus Neomarinimicrobiota bacterium]